MSSQFLSLVTQIAAYTTKASASLAAPGLLTFGSCCVKFATLNGRLNGTDPDTDRLKKQLYPDEDLNLEEKKKEEAKYLKIRSFSNTMGWIQSIFVLVAGLSTLALLLDKIPGVHHFLNHMNRGMSKHSSCSWIPKTFAWLAQKNVIAYTIVCSAGLGLAYTLSDTVWVNKIRKVTDQEINKLEDIKQKNPSPTDQNELNARIEWKKKYKFWRKVEIVECLGFAVGYIALIGLLFLKGTGLSKIAIIGAAIGLGFFSIEYIARYLWEQMRSIEAQKNAEGKLDEKLSTYIWNNVKNDVPKFVAFAATSIALVSLLLASGVSITAISTWAVVTALGLVAIKGPVTYIWKKLEKEDKADAEADSSEKAADITDASKKSADDFINLKEFYQRLTKKESEPVAAQ